MRIGSNSSVSKGSFLVRQFDRVKHEVEGGSHAGVEVCML